MPKFAYEAMDATGNQLTEVIEAADEESAQESIRLLGRFLTRISEIPQDDDDTLEQAIGLDSETVMTAARTAQIERNTNETQIVLSLKLDGAGLHQCATRVGFFDHMLNLFARHGVFDLAVTANGDLHVDQHHTVEDVGICLGQAFKDALADKRGIRRYGHFMLPMEDALASVAIDFSGRPYLVFNADFPSSKIGDFDSELVAEFWQAFTNNAGCNLHINVPYGRNSHHISEAIFKATASAARMAVASDPRMPGIPSTKGSL